MISLKKFQNEFSINGLIKSGSFGSVYAAQDPKGHRYAVKIFKKELIKAKSNFLFSQSSKPLKEGKILSKLQGIAGIPKIYFSGVNPATNSHMLITELLGDDLRTKILQEKYFSPEFIARIGLKMINVLEAIHEKNIIHCDIKPDNILLSSSNKEQDDMYLIDFGLSRFYEKKITKSKQKFYGSLFYAAIDFHYFKNPEKKHDLESLGFLLLHFIQNSLPWQNIEKSENFSEILKNVAQRKEKFMQEELNTIPISLGNFFKYIRNVKSSHIIDYNYLRQLMIKLKKELNDAKEKKTNQLASSQSNHCGNILNFSFEEGNFY